jgi:hypothetical protein
VDEDSYLAFESLLSEGTARMFHQQKDPKARIEFSTVTKEELSSKRECLGRSDPSVERKKREIWDRIGLLSNSILSERENSEDYYLIVVQSALVMCESIDPVVPVNSI